MSLDLLDLRNNNIMGPYSLLFDVFYKKTVVLLSNNEVCRSYNFLNQDSEFKRFAENGDFHHYYNPLRIGYMS